MKENNKKRKKEKKSTKIGVKKSKNSQTSISGVDKKKDEEIKTKEIKIEVNDLWSNVAYDRSAAKDFSLFGTFGAEETKNEEKIEKKEEIGEEGDDIENEQKEITAQTISTKKLSEIKQPVLKKTTLFDFFNNTEKLINNKENKTKNMKTSTINDYNHEQIEPYSYFMRRDNIETIKNNSRLSKFEVKKIYKKMLKNNNLRED
eukprot:TRINITY_DN4393_c2_g1_i1.p1 TRINITY_DN4393_c2_g1~~TRINITY_DN4393_c2_g1_i1.p1  ORF type:complete len:203 (-),score=58.01 TRINITY_DN4393_c2_g1_i1:39-647(-)